jgi:hypothetical protein
MTVQLGGSQSVDTTEVKSFSGQHTFVEDDLPWSFVHSTVRSKPQFSVLASKEMVGGGDVGEEVRREIMGLEATHVSHLRLTERW